MNLLPYPSLRVGLHFRLMVTNGPRQRKSRVIIHSAELELIYDIVWYAMISAVHFQSKRLPICSIRANLELRSAWLGEA